MVSVLHTFSFINAQNERFWVKFHFKSMQGIENIIDDEAAKIVGADAGEPSTRPVRSDRARRFSQVAFLRAG